MPLAPAGLRGERATGTVPPDRSSWSQAWRTSALTPARSSAATRAGPAGTVQEREALAPSRALAEPLVHLARPAPKTSAPCTSMLASSLAGKPEQRARRQRAQAELDPRLRTVVADERRRSVQAADEDVESAGVWAGSGCAAMTSGSSRVTMKVSHGDGSPGGGRALFLPDETRRTSRRIRATQARVVPRLLVDEHAAACRGTADAPHCPSVARGS